MSNTVEKQRRRVAEKSLITKWLSMRSKSPAFSPQSSYCIYEFYDAFSCKLDLFIHIMFLIEEANQESQSQKGLKITQFDRENDQTSIQVDLVRALPKRIYKRVSPLLVVTTVHRWHTVGSKVLVRGYK